MPRRATPGFFAGFSALPRGVGFLLGTPRSWPWALVPGAVLLVLSLALGWAGVSAARALVDAWLGAPTGDLARAAVHLAGWVSAALGALFGLLIALALTPPLSAPALERIVELEERALDAPLRTPLGFWSEVWCGLRAQAMAALLAVPCLALLWLVELAFAPAIFVTLPLKLLVSALSLAWNLFDYPLTLRGVGMRRRLRLVARHARTALGFGLGFAVLFWVPCFGVLLLPVGVAAATRLVWRILASDPELLPELARPVPAGLSSGPALSPADAAAESSARS
jgi:CysZ protein